MKSTKILAALSTVALSLSTNSALAAGSMEKCKVSVGNKGYIKAGLGDCGNKNNSCKGNNGEGDPHAWVMVPEGKCQQINNGNFENVSQDIQEKIRVEDLQSALKSSSGDNESNKDKSHHKKSGRHERPSTHVEPDSYEKHDKIHNDKKSLHEDSKKESNASY